MTIESNCNVYKARDSIASFASALANFAKTYPVNFETCPFSVNAGAYPTRTEADNTLSALAAAGSAALGQLWISVIRNEQSVASRGALGGLKSNNTRVLLSEDERLVLSDLHPHDWKAIAMLGELCAGAPMKESFQWKSSQGTTGFIKASPERKQQINRFNAIAAEIRNQPLFEAIFKEAAERANEKLGARGTGWAR